MAPSTAARSIAQVSQDAVRVGVRGTVHTVFPIRACMPPTANQSETQDYGRVGSDGPIEGATKIFQIILRDSSIPEHRSGGGVGSNHHVGGFHHRINAYFYDKWADDNHSRIGPGDEVEISGPAARLVRPDPSASDNGDHPFCLVFHTGDDDDLLALSAVAMAHVGGGSAGVVEDTVSCKVVRKAAGSTGGAAAGRGSGGRRGGGGRRAKAPYAYTTLDSLRVREKKGNVYGVVCSFTHRHQSKGRDMTNSLSLLDETCAESDSAVPCNFFSPTPKGLPAPAMVGDIVRLHRAKIQEYRGRPQLVAHGGAAWLIIRKKQAVRETYQRAPVKVCIRTGNAGGGGADVDDEDPDPDPDEDSPPSGPDAGGGEVDAVLPAKEWEVQASSANYTLSQADQERCEELSAWLEKKAEHLWLKPSSEVKVWVQDIFRRPQSGPLIAEFEVDLVCCLVSKHEKSGGGAGSLENIYVADGTGFASSIGKGEWAHRRDAAFLKGVRAALGDSAWTPADPRPSPIPAHLKIEVAENKKEWEALALSPGMWVRLRRLAISKNRETGTMWAKMKDKGSSVNPLHPSMGEVQHIARNYAAHCGGVNAGSSGSSGGGGAVKEALSRTRPRPPSAPPAGAPQAEAATVPPGASARKMHPADGVGAPSNGGSVLPPESAGRGAGAGSTSGAVAKNAASGHVGGAGGAAISAGAEAGSSSATSGSQMPPRTSLPARHGAGGTADWRGAAPAPRPGPHPGRGRGGGIAGSARPAAPPTAAGRLASFNKAGMARMYSLHTARGTKRALPASGERAGAGAEAEEASTLPGGRRVSNLGVLRSTAPPSVFDMRAKIVSHWPSKVENFVRKGPRWSDGPRFLFTLKLEDDHGVVEAVAAGPDASRLLPGSPSPRAFLESHDARARTERVLARIEAAADAGEEGGRVALRLRSYLAPLVEVGRRGEKCKRYSIIAPSCLEEDGAEGLDAQGKG